MAGLHGGKRPGAGRKPKAKAEALAAPTTFASVLDYLRAVALGQEPGDSLRVAAAKAALPFEAPKARAPVESPPPAKLRSTVTRAAERSEQDDFAKRAAEIRRKHNRRETP